MFVVVNVVVFVLRDFVVVEVDPIYASPRIGNVINVQLRIL